MKNVNYKLLVIFLFGWKFQLGTFEISSGALIYLEFQNVKIKIKVFNFYFFQFRKPYIIIRGNL